MKRTENCPTDCPSLVKNDSDTVSKLLSKLFVLIWIGAFSRSYTVGLYKSRRTGTAVQPVGLKHWYQCLHLINLRINHFATR